MAVATFLAVGAPAAAMAQAPTAATATSNTLDLEFWKSVERIGSPGAFHAYLDKFPSGLFAPLAREALLRSGAAPAQAPSVVSPPAATSPAGGAAAAVPAAAASGPGAFAGLSYFTEPASSGAIEFAIGDRFNGPGPVTVGWALARKQVLLPEGHWVVLAATDHNDLDVPSMAPTVPVTRSYLPVVPGSLRLTTVALAKFRGNRLATLMLVMLNRQPLPDQRTSAEGERCEGGQGDRIFEIKDGPFYRRLCAYGTVVAQPLADTTLVGPVSLLNDLAARLTRLGAQSNGPGLATTMLFSGKTDGWMRLQRIDFPAIEPALAALTTRDWQGVTSLDANDPRPTAIYVRQLRAWLDGYRSQAMSGWRRGIEEVDLQPGAEQRKSTVVGDFSPRL